MASNPRGRKVTTVEGRGVRVAYPDAQSGDMVVIPGTSGKLIVRGVDFLADGRVRVHFNGLTAVGSGTDTLILLSR